MLFIFFYSLVGLTGLTHSHAAPPPMPQTIKKIINKCSEALKTSVLGKKSPPNSAKWITLENFYPEKNVKIRFKIYGLNPQTSLRKPQRILYIFGGLMTDLERIDSYAKTINGFLTPILKDPNTTVVSVELLGQGKTYLHNKHNFGESTLGQIAAIPIEDNIQLAAEVIDQTLRSWNLKSDIEKGSLRLEVFGKSYGGKIANAISKKMEQQPKMLTLFDPGVMTWFRFLYPDLSQRLYLNQSSKEILGHMIAGDIKDSLAGIIHSRSEEWRLDAATSLTIGLTDFDGTQEIIGVSTETEVLLVVPGQHEGIIPRLMTYEMIKSRISQGGKIKVLFIPEASHNLYLYLNESPQINKLFARFKRDVESGVYDDGFYQIMGNSIKPLKTSDFLEFAITDTLEWTKINDTYLHQSFAKFNSFLQWLPWNLTTGVGLNKVLYLAEKELEEVRFREKALSSE